jgi:nitrogen fixation protein FixH
MKKGWYWPFILAGLMAVVLGANLILVLAAYADPSFAVEKDYYRKALAWDEKRAQDRRNAELGWTFTFEFSETKTREGTLPLSARLLDGSGEEIRDAVVTLEAFHNARASRILHAEMRPEADAGYSAALPIRRPGLWEFRFEAVRGGERFTRTTVREVGWR